MFEFVVDSFFFLIGNNKWRKYNDGNNKVFDKKFLKVLYIMNIILFLNLEIMIVLF